MKISWPEDKFADQFFTQDIYERNDERFRKMATEVFHRDNFTCKYCKFHCKPNDKVWNAYFQLRATNGNYRELKTNNLATVCPFCHAFFNLRYALLSGDYLPGLSSMPLEQLSLICKSAFALTSRGNAVSDNVELVVKDLKLMTTNLFMILPKDLPSPTRSENSEPEMVKHETIRDFFSTMVIMAEGDHSASQSLAVLKQISPIPIRQKFNKAADFWYVQTFEQSLKSENISNFMESI